MSFSQTALLLFACTSIFAVATDAPADARATGACKRPVAIVNQVQSQLPVVVNPSDGNGGIFKPNLMWSAVVDCEGVLCSVAKTGDAWPGSRVIAVAETVTISATGNKRFPRRI